MQGNTLGTYRMRWFDIGLIRELPGQAFDPWAHLWNTSQTVQGIHLWNGERNSPGWSSAEHNWFGRTQLCPYAGSTTSGWKLPTSGGNPHRAALKSAEQVVRLKHTCSAEPGPQRTNLSFLLQVPPSSLVTINRCVGARDRDTREENLQGEALQEYK
jgi:hypothetical protein